MLFMRLHSVSHANIQPFSGGLFVYSLAKSVIAEIYEFDLR